VDYGLRLRNLRKVYVQENQWENWVSEFGYYYYYYYLLTYRLIIIITDLLTYLLTYLLIYLLAYLLIYLFIYLLYLLTYLLTYLFTYLFTYLLTYLFTYLFTYLLIYLLTLFIYLLIYLLTYLLTYLLIYLLTYLLYLLTYLFTCLLIYILTYLFTCLLIYILTYLFTYLLTYLFTYLLIYLLTYLLNLLTYLLQLFFHSVAVVIVLVQTKQIRTSIHKRNNKKTQYKTTQNTCTVNTSTHITQTTPPLSKHPHIHSPILISFLASVRPNWYTESTYCSNINKRLLFCIAWRVNNIDFFPSTPNDPLNIIKCSALWVFKNWFPAENSFSSSSVIITESSLFRILITKGWTWQQWCLLTDKHEDLEQGPAVLLSKHPWIQGIPRICMLSKRVIVFVNRGRPVYLSSSSGSQEFSCLTNAAYLSVDSEELLIFLPRHIVVSSNRLLETIKQEYTWEFEAVACGHVDWRYSGFLW